ncbi:MAG: ABC transporter permease [Clostridiales bacterium]|nr:ABC transporter permease [Clostridiales bacterium]
MLKYILKRLVYMVFVFLVVTLLMYSLYNLIPSDPARAQVEPMRNTLKPDQYEAMYKQIRLEMGLDDPLLVRYARWMGLAPNHLGKYSGLLQGNFGYSNFFKKPVIEVIPEPMKYTIFMNIFVTILALGITIPLGIKTAVKKDSRLDRGVQVISVVGYSIPIHIIALVMIFLFAVVLRIFPVMGMKTPGSNYTGMQAFWDLLYHVTLPVLVLTFASLGSMTRYVRAAMIDALSMDYVRTARAKGVREKVVIYSHAWRNALLPVITIIISWFLGIFGGSTITESTFSLNGMGRLNIQALYNKDYELALAIQLFYIVVSLIGRIIIDLSYGLVDPRVRITK